MAQVGTQSGVRTNRQKAQDVRNRELEDVRLILGSDAGRRFLWRYLDFCGIHSCVYQEGAALSWTNGKRMVGVTMLQDVSEADPSAYVKMQVEARDRDLKEKLAQAAEDAKAEKEEIDG